MIFNEIHEKFSPSASAGFCRGIKKNPPAFKWAVQHTKKEFAILKEEIGHHLQNLRALELTYRRDSDEKSQPLPPVTKMRPEARGNFAQI